MKFTIKDVPETVLPVCVCVGIVPKLVHIMELREEGGDTTILSWEDGRIEIRKPKGPSITLGMYEFSISGKNAEDLKDKIISGLKQSAKNTR
jgi:hypothetical protein